MTPYFSIIIPTYNRCELVQKTIETIMSQDFNAWECIIINDGSTDNTAEIIPEFIRNDQRFIFVNQVNSERAISRNNGAKLALGKYFIFLDSDDQFESNHLTQLHNFIVSDNEQIGLYFSNGKLIHDDTSELIVENNVPDKLPLDYFLINSVVPARVSVHRSLFDHFSFDPRTIVVEDTVLWTEIMQKHPVKYIPISSVIYNWHGNNSVNIEKFNAYLQRLNGLKVLFFNKPVSKEISDKIKRKHLNRCYYGIADYYLFQNKKGLSLWWIVKSILKYPELDLKYKLVRLSFFFKFVTK
jgi:glycosyltransferase involved in cell wall biosynthesis